MQTIEEQIRALKANVEHQEMPRGGSGRTPRDYSSRTIVKEFQPPDPKANFD